MKKLLISVLLIAAGVALILVSSKMKARLNDPSYLRIQATISDIQMKHVGDSKEHSVFVQFDLNGETKEAELDGYSSSMRIGNSIDILVDEGNPSFVYQNSKTGYRVMLIFGFVCFLVSVLNFAPKSGRRVM